MEYCICRILVCLYENVNTAKYSILRLVWYTGTDEVKLAWYFISCKKSLNIWLYAHCNIKLIACHLPCDCQINMDDKVFHLHQWWIYIKRHHFCFVCSGLHRTLHPHSSEQQAHILPPTPVHHRRKEVRPKYSRSHCRNRSVGKA